MVFEDFFAQSAYYFRIDNAFLWPITNNGTKQIMTCNRRFARVNAFPFVPNINHQLQLGWSQFYFGRSIETRWNLHSNSPPMYALALTQSWCFPGVPQFASVVQPRAVVELCLWWVVGSLYYRELSVKKQKILNPLLKRHPRWFKGSYSGREREMTVKIGTRKNAKYQCLFRFCSWFFAPSYRMSLGRLESWKAKKGISQFWTLHEQQQRKQGLQ